MGTSLRSDHSNLITPPVVLNFSGAQRAFQIASYVSDSNGPEQAIAEGRLRKPWGSTCLNDVDTTASRVQFKLQVGRQSDAKAQRFYTG